MDETAELVQQPKTQEEILAARREARRKKILENSSNRLSKIVGQEMAPPPSPKSADSVTDECISTTGGYDLSPETFPADDETTSESSYSVYPDPIDERLEYIRPQVEALLANSGINDDSFLNAMPAGTNPNGDIFQLLNTLNQAQTNGGLFGAGPANATASQRSSSQSTSAAARNNSWYAKILRSKIHLVVASIVAYLLFATGNESYIGGNVFLPLLAWELIELLTIGTSEPANGQKLLGIVFMLGGVPMKTSHTIMKLMNTVNKVLKDVAFFMFFFVLTHLLWSKLWLGIELRYVLGYDQLVPPA